MPLVNLNNAELQRFVNEIKALTNPSEVIYCDGSEEEAQGMYKLLIDQGACIKLKKRPNSYYFRSDPADTARVESKTFIACRNREDAGPLNNWVEPASQHTQITKFFTNAFVGRPMYVVLFCMGPITSDMSKLCVQITDSPYVVLHTRIMARMGQEVVDKLGQYGKFLHLLHATTNSPEVAKSSWPCDTQNFFITHFIEAGDNELHVASYGSGYGGNALLGKKAVSLRMASVQGRREGWLAEHMLLMGVKDVRYPEQGTTYLTCALPSACGKTNLAMMQSALPESIQITTCGDDIVWMKPNPVDGKLYAINSENGFFGVAPGTNYKSNPTAMHIIEKDTLFTNVALFPDHSDIWFEGMEQDTNGVKPSKLIDWMGNDWTPDCGRVSSHPNARFTSPLVNCPILDPSYNKPVPISAILYGGRRSTDVPLVYQAFNIQSGVYAGLSCSSETTAAQEGAVNQLRNDPFALKPFLAYHIGDYVAHLLKILSNLKHKPLMFHVNWFRRDTQTHKFLWPGFTENTRVIKWIVDRVHGRVGALESPLGYIPGYQDFDWTGINYTQETWNKLMEINPQSMKMSTLMNQEQLFLAIGNRLPPEMTYLRLLLAARL